MVPVALVVVFALRSPAQTDVAEDKAVAVVEKKGGSVSRGRAPGKPVTAVNLQFSYVTDAELKKLAPLKDLTKLTFYMAKNVSDAGMKELAPFTKLAELNLAG